MSLGTRSPSIRGLLAGRCSPRYILTVLSAAGATMALGGATAHAQGLGDVTQGSTQDATSAAAQVLPINASVLPVNANVPVCLSLGTCSNDGNSANQAVVQRNSARSAAVNGSSQSADARGKHHDADCRCDHQGSDPRGDDHHRGDPRDVSQGSSQSATAAAAQVLPVNASVLPVNANVPVCAGVIGCSNDGNSANQATVQGNSAGAAALNGSRQRA